MRVVRHTEADSGCCASARSARSGGISGQVVQVDRVCSAGVSSSSVGGKSCPPLK